MRKPVLWFVGLACLATVGGCDRGDATVSAINTEPPVRSAALVEATLPERRDVSEFRSETAHITAENQVEVLAKGTGHCMSVLVEAGDSVEKGQVIAELDKAEMEAQVMQSEANVSQQRMTYERAQKLYDLGIGSEADRDNSKSSFEQAKATLEVQKVQLAFLTIRAPISGVVTKRLIQQGMLVSSGMPVFNIVDPESYILPIMVVESDLPRLRVGQKALVTVDSAADREFVAHVRRINPGVDLQTGSVKVILEFDPADHQYLRESAFARYSLVMDTHEDALVVPKDAIIEENARQFVMVVKEAPKTAAVAPDKGDGVTLASLEKTEAPQTVEPSGETLWVASRVEVETGLEDSSFTEVLSGIDADSLVITLGQQTVNDGDAVEVGNLEQTLASRDSMSTDDLLEQARAERQGEDRPKAPEADATP